LFPQSREFPINSRNSLAQAGELFFCVEHEDSLFVRQYTGSWA
jgi:hypothetical protein